MALAAVLVLSLLVVLLLPRLVPDPTGDTQQAAGTEVRTSPDSTAASRAAAEQTLQKYLRLQARLQLGNASVWGMPVWDEAAALAVNGDRLFGERNFENAARAYADALHSLEQLESRKPQIFAAALEAGLSALQADNPDVAQQLFERALAVEPGHALARRSLARAQARPAVLQGMAAGAQAESKDDLEAARTEYAAALRLDSEYQPARDSLDRVTGQLIDRRFRAAMSRVLVALDKGRLDEAGKALETAAQLHPEAGVVRDARLRLSQARQQSSLSRLRRKAVNAVRDEDWQGAALLYKKALKIDANAGFARNGLVQAEARVKLHRQFDRYLDDPRRLYSAEPLANAQTLLSAVGEAPVTEARLADKIRRLAKQVAAVRVPVQVRLRSDGETDVVIYPVARLGRFTERQLELRPGTYTAVGSRPGYRDVRKIFVVSPGQAPPPVDIRCEEPV